MIYTTAQIKDLLEIEKKENTFVSRQILDETIVWCERFSSYPEIEFDLEGKLEPFLFLRFLDNNKISIEQAVLRKKNKRGPKPKSAEKIRKNLVGVYFSDAELADIATRAGTNVPCKQAGGDTASRRKISAFIRKSLLSTVPT